jgi:hypothetical protein
VVNYDGKVFRSGSGATARWHQAGDLVWADFAGGDVRRGSLTGRCRPDGSLELAYSMVLAGGEVVAGHCTSTPERLPDGRIRLRERWRRFTPHPTAGLSTIEEVAETFSAKPGPVAHRPAS